MKKSGTDQQEGPVEGARPIGIAAAVLATCGVAGMLLGFVYDILFAGLPYQDPTPEMQAEWAFHKDIADTIELGGVFLFGLAILVVLGQRFLHMGRRS